MDSFVLIAEGDPGQAPQGRYEFRIWPRVWPRAARLVQKSWPLAGADRRSDIYLFTPHSPLRLVKLRGGTQLEAKRRGRDLGPLQYWTHHSYPRFPLSHRALRALAQELGTACLPAEAGLSPAHLVAGLGASAPDVLPVTVGKARLRFQKAGSSLEICHVVSAGQSRRTLAVEDPDPDSALRALDGLGIGHLPNLSYGDALWARTIPVSPTSTPSNRTL
ncbi:hypothetical protein [Paracoccus salsus]|uniref:hypothetical protein n=1 Tax=Paracoccus salsus TaxID=2911061 RepID=UPI001F247C08|nr:hypothetical protein [Paracoccus salsus]MCF3974691.1 hypothetical protein [Paracoccus salsus]